MNAKNPILIAAVAVLLVGFGFFHFALQPKQKQASELDGKIETAQSELEAARQLLQSNSDARQTYKASYATVVRLGKAVPGDDDVRSLVVQLDAAAKRSRVDFQSIEVAGSGAAAAATSSSDGAAGAATPLPPGATVGPAGFPVMPFSFTFRGGFFRLGNFFQRLDAFVTARNRRLDVSGRLLTIDGLKLEPDASGFPNVKATVQATSYLISPSEGTTGGATPAGPPGSTTETGAPSTDATTPPTTTATIR